MHDRCQTLQKDLPNLLLCCIWTDVQSLTPTSFEEKICKPNPHHYRICWFTWFWCFLPKEQRQVSDLRSGSETFSILLTQLAFTTLRGWIILFNSSQRGSSFTANRVAFSKSSLNCLATVSNCTIKIRSVSFVIFFVHLKNKLLGKNLFNL